MKSIKNQYIALKEGKMTEAQFMRNVRMTLPEYISNVTLFKQAERILMNKGIISEALISSKVEQLANKIIKWYENHPNPKMKERISSVESTLEKLMSKTIGKDSINYEDFEKTVKSKFNLPFEDPSYSVFKNSLKEAKDTSATGYFNQDGKEQYGKFNELDNMNAQEIMAGYVMEKQDNPDIDIKEAIKTVLKNLKKDQFYYTNYKLSGIRDLQPTEFTTTKRKPFFDQMEELDKKGTNLVDEKNKMQVVKEDLNKLQKMNEVKRMQQLAGLIKESKLVRKLNENQEYSAELSVDNIKNIIKDTNRFYREDKTTIEETSDGSIYVSMNGSRLMGETRTTLEKLFDVREESEEFASDRLPSYTYFISTKTTSDQDTPQKDKDFDEDVFEGKKDKLKELVRKMMKEMFDERDNFTDIE
jgi:hypothetical protein